MLTGQLAPDSGTVELGTNLEIATLDQKREDLNPEETLAHYLTDGRGENLLVNGEQRHVTGYMKEFLFQPEQARTPIRSLSGGERARLMLARIMSRPANLLILDEPTNDLDIETLDLLQEIVAGFPGTVILVSHDRDFLDRTVTSTIAPAVPDAPDGRWIEYAGGYSDMLAQRKGAIEERRKAEKAAGRAKPQKQPPPPRRQKQRASFPSNKSSRSRIFRRQWPRQRPRLPNARSAWPTPACSPGTPQPSTGLRRRWRSSVAA